MTHLAPGAPTISFCSLGDVGLQAFGVALVQPRHLREAP
jgi:hypothetical protein